MVHGPRQKRPLTLVYMDTVNVEEQLLQTVRNEYSSLQQDDGSLPMKVRRIDSGCSLSQPGREILGIEWSDLKFRSQQMPRCVVSRLNRSLTLVMSDP